MEMTENILSFPCLTGSIAFADFFCVCILESFLSDSGKYEYVRVVIMLMRL